MARSCGRSVEVVGAVAGEKMLGTGVTAAERLVAIYAATKAVFITHALLNPAALVLSSGTRRHEAKFCLLRGVA